MNCVDPPKIEIANAYTVDTTPDRTRGGSVSVSVVTTGVELNACRIVTHAIAA